MSYWCLDRPAREVLMSEGQTRERPMREFQRREVLMCEGPTRERLMRVAQLCPNRDKTSALGPMTQSYPTTVRPCCGERALSRAARPQTSISRLDQQLAFRPDQLWAGVEMLVTVVSRNAESSRASTECRS